MTAATPTPPMPVSELNWTLDDATTTRPFELSDASTMFALLQSSRAHLDRWLRWSSSIRTEQDAIDTIALAVTRREAGLGFHCGIWVGEELAGGMVCRDLDPLHRHAELGYWLGKDFTGRGLATLASRRSVDYLFGIRNLHRLYMQCGADNVRSRAVPERLGFKLEGVLRDSHWITTSFMDHAVYGLLTTEWPRPAART